MSNAQLMATNTWNNLKFPLIAYGLIFGSYAALSKGQFIWFSWHPFSMIVGFITVTCNAALIKKIGGRDNTLLHGYLMILSLAFGLWGWYVIHTNKNMYNKEHWTSNHGKLGALFMLVYTAVALGGAVALNPDWGFFRKNNTVRTAHKWFGRVLIASSWCLCVQGLLKIIPDQIVPQALFALPLLAFGFYCLL